MISEPDQKPDQKLVSGFLFFDVLQEEIINFSKLSKLLSYPHRSFQTINSSDCGDLSLLVVPFGSRPDSPGFPQRGRPAKPGFCNFKCL